MCPAHPCAPAVKNNTIIQALRSLKNPIYYLERSMIINMKKLFLSLILAISLTFSFAGEGMWLPLLLKALNEAEMQSMGLDVLYDDRDVRPGVKFADAELIGIPHRIVIAERGLANGELEYRHRRDDEARNVKRADALKLLQE